MNTKRSNPDISWVPFSDAHDDQLVALQNRCAPEAHRWNVDQLHRVMCDEAHGNGAQALVALDPAEDEVCGFAGWVHAGEEFYGAPCHVGDRTTGSELIGRLVTEAAKRRASWIRISSWPQELEKQEALTELGFRPLFRFLDLVADVSQAPAKTTCTFRGSRVPRDAVDPEALRNLVNTCFAAVPNSPPITTTMAEDAIRGDQVWPEATQVWADADGVYRAFLFASRHGHIDELGVHPAIRRTGSARMMLQHVLSQARREGRQHVSVVIADGNDASLRLHQGAGFQRTTHRTVWQFQCC